MCFLKATFNFKCLPSFEKSNICKWLQEGNLNRFDKIYKLPYKLLIKQSNSLFLHEELLNFALNWKL
jgi:hypothetical protein